MAEPQIETTRNDAQAKVKADNLTGVDLDNDFASGTEADVEDDANALAAELWDAVNREPKYQEALFRTLEFCRTETSYEETEQYIASNLLPTGAVIEPYQLIARLIEYGGLFERWYLSGEEVNEERARTELEEGAEQSAVIRTVEITECGAMVAEAMAPKNRLEELFACKPQYQELYEQVIEYCRQPRSLAELKALLEVSPLVATYKDYENKVYPSFFMDGLNQAGALEYDQGWKSTQEALDFLETSKSTTE